MRTKKSVFLFLMGVIIINWLLGCNKVDKGIAYLHHEAGWQITIPESWESHYLAVQNEDGAIDFYFCGQSEYCRKDLYSDVKGGLYFFSITDNIPVGGDVIDYARVQWLDMYYADYDPGAREKSYLGAVDNVDYYIALRANYIHSQEYDWGIGGINRLFLIDEKGSYINRQTGTRETLEPDEFELVKIDISKASEMLTDLEKKVQKSFKPL